MNQNRRRLNEPLQRLPCQSRGRFPSEDMHQPPFPKEKFDQLPTVISPALRCFAILSNTSWLDTVMTLLKRAFAGNLCFIHHAPVKKLMTPVGALVRTAVTGACGVMPGFGPSAESHSRSISPVTFPMGCVSPPPSLTSAVIFDTSPVQSTQASNLVPFECLPKVLRLVIDHPVRSNILANLGLR